MSKLKFIVLFFVIYSGFLSMSGQDRYMLAPVPKLVIEKDGLPQKPTLQQQQTVSVYDYAHMLTDAERKKLQEKISKYNDSTSTQIVIATIKKLNDDISLYATEWAHKWGIGQKNKGNGIFILISRDDHKITIRTGYGVEHLLTDALSRRIIERDIIPYFKQGKFYEGLNTALDTIQKILSGEFTNDTSDSESWPFWAVFLFIFFMIIIIALVFGNSSGSSGSSSGGGPIIYTSSGSSSSWGSSSGSSSFGGGFSGGFGGGGFGGGGATGSW